MFSTEIYSRLCSSRAEWPVAPNFCSWATRKSSLFHRKHKEGTLDFTSSEHWAPFNFFSEHSLDIDPVDSVSNALSTFQTTGAC